MNAAIDAPPLAKVGGQPWTRIPQDLYIPPDALEVFLDTFEGPLDLLLYLIRRQNISILDIPIAEITRQYMEYLTLMQELQLELAAEYLLMAAWLAEIKSRLLLPRPAQAEAEELDPRAELVRRLQEYERFQQAALTMDALPRLERDVFTASAAPPERQLQREPPPVSLADLLSALRDVMARAELFGRHHIQQEALSVRERMSGVLESLDTLHFTPFTALFYPEEGRRGVVVTFMAILELLREALLELVQIEPFAPIHLRRRM
ncbi:MAG TPA: segregation/condensation protein A [Candidatus Competibacteraceae bacterium]|nr:segregation/condensation protein A [Candidatus Competibacteraceae bacterium]MCP5132171.1 segregation/condensation protein A [Gammaproteobacteria bacterium]HPF58095.1 segregation/condensation protein A [Candidatus Competibacteraceae bacterium]HRY19504.1 segregation/condensation protein A [Candidatus Competibacteraceae bacterium]